MKVLLLAGVCATVVLVTAPAFAQSRHNSASGPRGPSGGVEFAPVDRLGATLPPDGMLTPNSGWNGSAAAGAGVAGPNNSPPELTPLFAPPPPPPPKGKQPYIILGQ